MTGTEKKTETMCLLRIALSTQFAIFRTIIIRISRLFHEKKFVQRYALRCFKIA